MRNHPRQLLALFSAALLLLTACSSSDDEACGNGRVEGKEQCDDGNTSDGDGCSSRCGRETEAAACGNGAVDVGEACDDGNTRNGDGCQNDCSITPPGQEVFAECGNGVQEIGEACDDANKTDGDGCESTCVLTRAPQEQCAGAASLPQPEAGATCKVLPPEGTPSGARLYLGVVLLDGKTLNGGQVLVNSAGTITCAACDCSGDAAAAGAVRISCPQGVISPALINSHDHIDYQAGPPAGRAERYESRQDWRSGTPSYNGHTKIINNTSLDPLITWAELRQVMSGTTSVASSGGRPGFLRDLHSADVAPTATADLGAPSAQLGLHEPELLFQTFPLNDSSGKKLTSGCEYSTGSIDTPAKIPGLSAYLPHVSEGIEEASHNEFRCLSGEGTKSQNLLSARSAFIHGVALTAADIGKMAERGTGLIWSPRSNMSLYGDTAMITTFKNMGVPIALGSDWLASGSMNILRELQCADYLNQSQYSQAFSDEQLWRMVTATAADLTDTWEKLGRIAPGKVGDLAIFKLKSFAASPHRAVITANPEDVVLTVRGGKPLYGDKALVTGLAGHPRGV